ncbi:hypothetical protein [Bifidobacterium dolichotidis]|uniref:hypothetical protein n=1 Tax=Bifidobacterium dolichotidis TaxID=2306976 RepID=UPI000F7E03E6|nr:hypothetical protein [Bifidobacterium dolichotidis]
MTATAQAAQSYQTPQYTQYGCAREMENTTKRSIQTFTTADQSIQFEICLAIDQPDHRYPGSVQGPHSIFWPIDATVHQITAPALSTVTIEPFMAVQATAVKPSRLALGFTPYNAKPQSAVFSEFISKTGEPSFYRSLREIMLVQSQHYQLPKNWKLAEAVVETQAAHDCIEISAMSMNLALLIRVPNSTASLLKVFSIRGTL